MEGSRPSKVVLASALQLIGKRLREDGQNLTGEELPERWVDLIRYLDEEERRATGIDPGAARKDPEKRK